MKRFLHPALTIGVMLIAIATNIAAEPSNDELVKKDHKQIEGTWRAVAMEVNGNKSSDEDVKKITVVNGADGSWILYSQDKEVMRGTSTIYPTQKPKTIDFTPTEGDHKGQVYLGIYVLAEKTRTLCFAPPGKARPTEFSSTPASENILITFERVKAK